ncbi:MAG TPA: ribosome small subunit-dependent GTPase A [Acidimicrobiales bacterium]|nr:ribosome small subunit-dependent GTPase A [Acidimicrobiales bacterium]
MAGQLTSFGWDDRVAALFAALDAPHAVAGRVARVDRGSCVVVTDDGPVRASPFGAIARQAGLDGVPATGDWVAVQEIGGDDPGVVAIAPRWSAISRKDPDERVTAEQVLAANVDVVGVVCALDRPVGQNRLERMLAAAWESGASPVVLLTKADLAPDLDHAVQAAGGAAGGLPVLVTSTVAGDGIDDVRALLRPARTLALLGPSGAGKSTLVNRLVGDEIQSTGAVREGDSRGRHTTTARQLVPVPGGGVLLDTPGLRSLPLWDAGGGLAAAFDDVEDAAAGCRFRDCRHDGEPGCAVRAAVADGSLDARRLTSYHKLLSELDALEAHKDEHARRAQGRRGAKLLRDVERLKGPRDR